MINILQNIKERFLPVLKNLWKKLKDIFFDKSFLEFCIAGAINTFNDGLFTLLFDLIFQENVAAVLGYAVSLTIAFFISSFVIFKSNPTFKKYIRFIISYVPNFIIYFLVTFITINVIGLPPFWGAVLAAMAGGPITFVIIKLYAFGKK